MEHDESEDCYYVKMKKDDGSYYYTPMNVNKKGKRYINLNKPEDEYEDEDDHYMKMQKEDGSYFYVHKKGEAAAQGGKIYDVCKERSRQYPTVQEHPESDQCPLEDLYENCATPATDHDGELYEEMERNPEELYMDMDLEKEDPSALYAEMESGVLIKHFKFLSDLIYIIL